MATSAWDNMKAFMGGTVLSTVGEMHAMMPDSLLFGSLLFYFLTQNMAYGVFAVFVFENVLVHRLISWIHKESVGAPVENDKMERCYAGYKTPQLNYRRMFNHGQYPPYGVFSISSIATYLALAMREYIPSLESMGGSWTSRSLVSSIFIGIVWLIFVLVRLYTGCDTFGDILVSLILAVIVGFVFYHANRVVFGTEAMNFLGLPDLSQKPSILICTKVKE
jgi:DMSO reductase anchor subunit